MLKERFRNTGKYTRLISRRDRIRIPAWLIIIFLFTVVIGAAYPELIPSEEERQMMAETMRNPAMTALFGPGYGLDDYHFGAMIAHQMLLITVLAVAVMNILLVARHTRGDEESGRMEILRSLPVGRLSNVGAITLVLWGANLLLSLVVGGGLYSLGLAGMDLEGSLLYGVVLGATGIFFAAVTALFAQLAESSRGTVGYSLAFLLLAYLVRAIGDVDSEAFSMVSPLGWVLRAEVYVNNYWWPVLLTLGAAVVVAALALYLNSLRDLGAGFIPSRPGRRVASRFLQGPLGLALRLQRTAIAAWAAGMLILGATYGSVMGDMEEYLDTLEIMQEMLPEVVEDISLMDQFIPMLLAVISMVCTIPVLLMILKIWGEETRNRMENLLARAVSRRCILGSYLLLAYFTSLLVQLFAVTGLWSAGAAVTEEPVSFKLIFDAGMIYLPAMWVMIGVAVLLMGFKPQAAGLTWLYLGYSFFVVYLGGILQLPDWMSSLTPYGHIPQLPVEDMNYPILALLTATALVLTVVGFLGYRERDIQG